MSTLINVADLRDPDDSQGRSYREVNATKMHNIPIGGLVQIKSNSIRLFVVWHGRDCDQTPLYWLSFDKSDTVSQRHGFVNPGWYGGYAEDRLTVIDEEAEQ